MVRPHTATVRIEELKKALESSPLLKETVKGDLRVLLENGPSEQFMTDLEALLTNEREVFEAALTEMNPEDVQHIYEAVKQVEQDVHSKERRQRKHAETTNDTQDQSALSELEEYFK